MEDGPQPAEGPAEHAEGGGAAHQPDKAYLLHLALYELALSQPVSREALQELAELVTAEGRPEPPLLVVRHCLRTLRDVRRPYKPSPWAVKVLARLEECAGQLGHGGLVQPVLRLVYGCLVVKEVLKLLALQDYAAGGGGGGGRARSWRALPLISEAVAAVDAAPEVALDADHPVLQAVRTELRAAWGSWAADKRMKSGDCMLSLIQMFDDKLVDERVAGLVCAGEEALPHTFFARVMEGQWEQFWGGMHGRGPPPRSDQALPAPEQQQAGPGRRLPQSIIRTVATPGEARPPYIVCYRPAPEAPPSAERKRKAERKDWSEEEVQYLLRMVKAAGRRWATICEAIRHDGAVNGSTLLQDQDPGQLRYKFKNLVRTGRLNVADYPKFPPGQEANGEESDSGSEYVSAR